MTNAKAHHRGKDQERTRVQAVGVQIRSHTEKAQDDRQGQHDGPVGAEEQNDSFHEASVKKLRRMVQRHQAVHHDRAAPGLKSARGGVRANAPDGEPWCARSARRLD